MKINDFFYKIAFEEKGNFGIWYEYLAKFRIFKKFKHCKRVLIFGLPEKYSLGLDTLFFADNSEVYVVESRKDILNNYKILAKKFKKKIFPILTPKLSNFKSKKKFDLILSTEVIQNDPSLVHLIKNFGKYIIIFIPNKKCYAHPKFSNLNSLSLRELKEIGTREGLKMVDSGYVDCPPWPAGAELEKEEELKSKNYKTPFTIILVKKILTKVIPILYLFDCFYPSPIKELNSHMIFGVFQNEDQI